MRNRTGIFIIYLLLSCLAVQQLAPVCAGISEMEFFESNSESEKNDSGAQKESFPDWKVIRDRFSLDDTTVQLSASLDANHMVGSDRIPVSAYRTIFSPPPNEV